MNATVAYQSVYHLEDPQVARSNGSRLLTNANVARLVADQQAALAVTLGITKERIAQELARIAFADARQLMSWGPDGLRLLPSSEISDDAAAAVAEVSQTTTQHGGSLRLKLHDKLSAIEKLARLLGYLNPDKQDDKEREQWTAEQIIRAIILHRQREAAGSSRP